MRHKQNVTLLLVVSGSIIAISNEIACCQVGLILSSSEGHMNHFWAGCWLAPAPFPEWQWAQECTGVDTDPFKVAQYCWNTCCQVVGEAERVVVMAELCTFNFCHLDSIRLSDEFTKFVQWVGRGSVSCWLYTDLLALILLIVSPPEPCPTSGYTTSFRSRIQYPQCMLQFGM